MIANFAWTEDSVKLKEIKSLQKLVGELSYINQCSRPDISFALNTVARKVSKGTKEAFRCARRILEYLVNTKDKNITYRKMNSKENYVLEVYSDASFADVRDEGFKSTAGYLIYLNGSLVHWKTTVIKLVCTSTTVSEFLATYLATLEALHIANLLEEVYDIKVWPIKIYSDNKSSINIIKNEKKKGATKYLGTKYYMLQQLVEDKKIIVSYVNTKENYSDGMTKSLPNNSFDLFQESCFTSSAEERRNVQEIRDLRSYLATAPASTYEEINIVTDLEFIQAEIDDLLFNQER